MAERRVARLVLLLAALALPCTACRAGRDLLVTAADDGRVVKAVVGDELHVDLGRGWRLEEIDAPQFHVRRPAADSSVDIELRRPGRATLEAERIEGPAGHWEVTVAVAGDTAPIVS